MIDEKKWFVVMDSELKDLNGEGTGVFNIEARFADHPILNVAKSKIARHNVYDLGPCLHMRILYNSDGGRAVKNGTSHVMRFDKGEDMRVPSQQLGPGGNMVLHYDGPEGMGKEGFEAAMRDIMRCFDAWQHYQLFREAPVTPLEQKAMQIIETLPSRRSTTIMVDKGGRLEPREIEQSDEDEDEDELPSRPAPRGKKKAA